MKELVERAVEDILPHRPPFLFVSRIISLEVAQSAVTEFDVTPDLSIFKGHFPSEPILPGVIILEMLAQTGGLSLLASDEYRGRIAYLAAVESARFRKPVRPGDVLRAESRILSVKRGIGKAVGRAFVGDEEVASATIVFAVPN
ncbi:MAG: 3-hydroxyacyl-ACP dehydratase FabZ [Bacillota bacterium]